MPRGAGRGGVIQEKGKYSLCCKRAQKAELKKPAIDIARTKRLRMRYQDAALEKSNVRAEVVRASSFGNQARQRPDHDIIGSISLL